MTLDGELLRTAQIVARDAVVVHGERFSPHDWHTYEPLARALLTHALIVADEAEPLEVAELDSGQAESLAWLTPQYIDSIGETPSTWP
jgi:hypothetical protein